MIEYPKIHNPFKRDPETNKVILWDWTKPEFGYLASNLWQFTEKVDGMNIRVMWDGQVVNFAGRTDKAVIPKNLTTWLTANFPPEKFAGFGDGVCLYGEGYGAGIQKVGNLYRPDQAFVLFDVRIGQWWLTRENVDDIAKQMNIQAVPVVGCGSLRHGVETVAEGMESYWGDFAPEGIVARPVHDLFTRSGERVICKIKGRDFCF